MSSRKIHNYKSEILEQETIEEYGYSPDYFYWNSKTKKYHSKQSQKKSATKCPKNITEREWCLDKGLYRIYDCGKKRWVYDLR